MSLERWDEYRDSKFYTEPPDATNVEELQRIWKTICKNAKIKNTNTDDNSLRWVIDQWLKLTRRVADRPEFKRILPKVKTNEKSVLGTRLESLRIMASANLFCKELFYTFWKLEKAKRQMIFESFKVEPGPWIDDLDLGNLPKKQYVDYQIKIIDHLKQLENAAAKSLHINLPEYSEEQRELMELHNLTDLTAEQIKEQLKQKPEVRKAFKKAKPEIPKDKQDTILSHIMDEDRVNDVVFPPLRSP